MTLHRVTRSSHPQCSAHCQSVAGSAQLSAVWAEQRLAALSRQHSRSCQKQYFWRLPQWSPPAPRLFRPDSARPAIWVPRPNISTAGASQAGTRVGTCRRLAHTQRPDAGVKLCYKSMRTSCCIAACMLQALVWPVTSKASSLSDWRSDPSSGYTFTCSGLHQTGSQLLIDFAIPWLFRSPSCTHHHLSLRLSRTLKAAHHLLQCLCSTWQPGKAQQAQTTCPAGCLSEHRAYLGTSSHWTLHTQMMQKAWRILCPMLLFQLLSRWVMPVSCVASMLALCCCTKHYASFIGHSAAWHGMLCYIKCWHHGLKDSLPTAEGPAKRWQLSLHKPQRTECYADGLDILIQSLMCAECSRMDRTPQPQVICCPGSLWQSITQRLQPMPKCACTHRFASNLRVTMYAGMHCLGCNTYCGVLHVDTSSILVSGPRRLKHVCTYVLHLDHAGERCSIMLWSVDDVLNAGDLFGILYNHLSRTFSLGGHISWCASQVTAQKMAVIVTVCSSAVMSSLQSHPLPTRNWVVLAARRGCWISSRWQLYVAFWVRLGCQWKQASLLHGFVWHEPGACTSCSADRSSKHQSMCGNPVSTSQAL